MDQKPQPMFTEKCQMCGHADDPEWREKLLRGERTKLIGYWGHLFETSTGEKKLVCDHCLIGFGLMCLGLLSDDEIIKKALCEAGGTIHAEQKAKATPDSVDAKEIINYLESEKGRSLVLGIISKEASTIRRILK